jgi:hypothetical protein
MAFDPYGSPRALLFYLPAPCCCVILASRSLGCRLWLGPCPARHRSSKRRCPRPTRLRWRGLGRAPAAGPRPPHHLAFWAPRRRCPALPQSAGGALLPETTIRLLPTASPALRREPITIRRHAAVRSWRQAYRRHQGAQPTPSQTDRTANWACPAKGAQLRRLPTRAGAVARPSLGC